MKREFYQENFRLTDIQTVLSNTSRKMLQ